MHKVTIVGRGLAGGYTMTLPEEDRHTMTKNDLFNMITYVLGGRVAEDVVFGDVSTGAQNDLERTSKMARRMVTEWGMSEILGPVVFGKSEEQVFLGRDFSHTRNYSEDVAGLIDSEVRKLIGECYVKAKEIIQTNRETLDRMVEALIEKETLTREEIDLICDGKTLADLENSDQKNDKQEADKNSQTEASQENNNDMNSDKPQEQEETDNK